MTFMVPIPRAKFFCVQIIFTCAPAKSEGERKLGFPCLTYKFADFPTKYRSRIQSGNLLECFSDRLVKLVRCARGLREKTWPNREWFGEMRCRSNVPESPHFQTLHAFTEMRFNARNLERLRDDLGRGSPDNFIDAMSAPATLGAKTETSSAVSPTTSRFVRSGLDAAYR